jgi:F-type H+-transporting ATPase subunit epsilon
LPVQVRVVSLEQSLFEGEAGFVIAHGASGELGILPGHAPLLTTLQPGPLVIKDAVGGPERELLVVSGGFLEVLPDRVTVLADAAEHAEDVSEQQAEEARRRAAQALEGRAEIAPEEAARMELELAMAEARLRLARVRRRGT